MEGKELKKKTKELKKEWKTELKAHKNLILLSFIFLAISLILEYIAGRYVDKYGTANVSDLILDHLPAINLSFLFICGYALVIAALLLYPFLFNVKKFHIVISQFSLLILIRSFFMSLTHLKAPADAIIPKLPYIYNLLVFNNDLFFSAHTAIPFLGFLLFRKQKIGIFFLIASFVLAATVLFMHVHYSIDVFAAFCITFCSYKLGSWFFRKVDNEEF